MKIVSRYLSEFELDTLIKIEFPAGLIEKGLLSELLETPKVFEDSARNFVERKRGKIDKLKTQKTISRLHRLWKLFEMASVFPILDFNGLSEVESERVQRIVTSEYHRLSCMIDKNRVELRNLRLEVAQFTKKTFEIRRKNNADWINNPNEAFEEMAKKEQDGYNKKIQKLLGRIEKDEEKRKKFEKYLQKQGRLEEV